MVILQQHSQTGEYPKYTNSSNRLDPLEDLKACPQWVAWRWGNVRKDGKRGKVPINPSTRRNASSNRPTSWGTYQQALACAQEHGMGGVGFMFTEGDPYFGWDLDNCREPDTGVIHPAALALAARFGTYYEVSPSGTGIKGVGIGSKPTVKGEKPQCATENTPWGGKIEIYDRVRFFTITEEVLGGRGSFVRDSQDALNSVYREFFPEPQKPVQPPVRMGANLTRTLTGAEILDKARNGKHGPKFIALYDHGDLSWSGNDASRADNDLMSQLAYWTGHDRAWMEALFSESALGRRDKWTSRPDYRKRTIDYAIAHSKKYEPEKHKPREGSTKTRDKLQRMAYHAVLGHPWTEKAGNHQGGARDYAAHKVFLREAYRANSLEIGMSLRELTERGGFGSTETATKAVASLIDTHGVLFKIDDGGPDKPARFRIKDIAPSILGQSKIEEQFFTNNHTPWVYVTVPELSKSVEIRNTSPATNKEFDKNGRRIVRGKAAPVNSLGKPAAMLLEQIHYYSRITGEPAPLEFLEERTGVRRDNLKDRLLRPLLDAGLILEDSDGYTTPENVRERLERELEDSGCNEKTRQQREKFAKEREIMLIHRMHTGGADFDRIARLTGRSVAEIMDILKIPDLAPSYDDLDRLKERREIKNADGYIEELERASELWPDTFPEPENEQEPLGHEYAPTPPPTPPPEPRESRLSRPEEAPRGNVPEDEHPLECDCLECSVPAPRYARIKAKAERHDYASLVA